ncbi:hypothetical protein CAE01nite_10470 [Cellulomonas aerilata]|uniref:D-inositol 3-phosphate glycosyltransferase n=1 Tax=Cellulomonas aerilata TaxID=515326 RepID=A0A512DA13_9CELL|nr:hypothetical protein CAE01nite_10470 [Cellulomonas aerilata]
MYPGVMEVGGSQINAVELAHQAAVAGHEVVLFGPGGDLCTMVADLGLEYIRSPQEFRWPSRANMAALERLVVARGIDVVHGYEWGPSLDLAFGPHRTLGTPMVTTVLSMDVPDHIPRHEPLVVGTRRLYEEQQARRGRVHLIEPPIDLVRNAPGGGGTDPRTSFGLVRSDVVVAVVCRLSSDLGKVDGVLDAIDTVGRLASTSPVRLLVVGTGPAAAQVRDRAAAVNGAAGRPIVVVTGQLLDPRSAYDAADVVLGMGSSALKGMAFGKPLVVQGEHGGWEPLTTTTVDGFLHHGWLGTGPGYGRDLESVLRDLLDDPAERARLGLLGRQTVLDRYSLAAAARTQAGVYEDAVAHRPTKAATARALRRCAVDVAKFKLALARSRIPAAGRVTGGDAWGERSAA